MPGDEVREARELRECREPLGLELRMLCLIDSTLDEKRFSKNESWTGEEDGESGGGVCCCFRSLR